MNMFAYQMGDMFGHGSPMSKKCLDMGMMGSPQYKLLKDLPDCDGSMVSSSSHNMKSESKKHPSLPKEVGFRAFPKEFYDGTAPSLD